MKVANKLIISFVVIAILIVMAGYLASSEVAKIASTFYKEADEQIPAVSSLSDMKAILQIIKLVPSEHIIRPDGGHIEILEMAQEEMNEALLSYEKAVGKEKAVDMGEDIEDLFTLARRIIRDKDNSVPEQTLQRDFSWLDYKLQVFDHKLDVEKDRFAEELRVTGETLKVDIQSTWNLTAVLTAVAAAIAIMIGIYISNSVSKPILKLKEAADQIGKGNFNVETRFSKGSDEIGELCIHFEKMRDGLKNKETMQDEFISIASHELRTPIQPILGAADLAAKGLIKKNEALKLIVDETKRLQRLANDILDVSRIESGRITYTMERLDLNDLITNIVKSYEVSLQNEVKFHTQLNTRAGLSIYADKTRITQVLNNVLGNAIKFTAKGHVSVETNYLTDKNQVHINIIDTGCGIPPDILPNLFGKFVTKNVKNENQQGTGLGLFISRAIVRAHNGEISARNSENGSGATITIILPVLTMDKINSENIASNVT